MKVFHTVYVSDSRSFVREERDGRLIHRTIGEVNRVPGTSLWTARLRKGVDTWVYRTDPETGKRFRHESKQAAVDWVIAQQDNL